MDQIKLKSIVFRISMILGLLLCSCREHSSLFQKEAPKNNFIAFRKTLSTYVNSTDPLQSFDVASAHIIHQLFDTLFEFDSNLEILPHLVSTYTYDAKNHIYHFFLKKGVLFTNNQELTSDDVVFTFQRFCQQKRTDWQTSEVIEGCKKNKKTLSQNRFGVKAVDRYSVDVKLNSNYPPFLINLTSPNFSILPKKFFGVPEEQYWKSPISTGSYILRENNKKQVILEANTNYFLGKPDIDKITYTIMSATESLEAFKKAQLDDALLPNHDKFLPDASIYKSYFAHFAKTCFIGFNVKQYPFNNIWFRKALESLIDKKAIMAVLQTEGIAEADGFIPYGVSGYSDEIKSPSPSLNSFREYLKRAGFDTADHVPPLTLHTTSSWWFRAVAPLIKSQLENAGLKISIKEEKSLSEHLQLVKQGKIDFSLVMMQLHQPEAYHFIEFFKSHHPLAAFQTSDNRFDVLLEKSQTTDDKLERAKLYQEADKIIATNAWTINLFYHI